MNKNPRTFLGRRDEADGGVGGGGRTLNIGMACATEADGGGGDGGGETLNNGIACATEAVWMIVGW